MALCVDCVGFPFLKDEGLRAPATAGTLGKGKLAEPRLENSTVASGNALPGHT